MFKAPSVSDAKKDEDGDENDEDDENFGKGDNSPPAFATGDAFGDLANRPVKLTIESRPPEKSPYVKIFNNIVEKFKMVTPAVVEGKKTE